MKVRILIRKGRSDTEWAINPGTINGWLTPSCNSEFSKWVYKNKNELVSIFGEGMHIGEYNRESRIFCPVRFVSIH